MSDYKFSRPVHNQVLALLAKLDKEFLARSQCWFGGGTRIVLELDEYRESADVALLCADRDGYRWLRETITESTLGNIGALTLAREVRADQYGIRTFVETEESKIKFEIIREARINLSGEDVAHIPIACLARRDCFAEKLLANADRGLDSATLSRDLIDLAFMIESWPRQETEAGMVMAVAAYGNAIHTSLGASLEQLRRDKAYRNRCIEGLAVTNTKTLNAGLKALAVLAD